MTEIIIDPEIRKLIPPLRDDERSQLEANLRRDGCRDPLALWAGKGILLDGHNRMEFCDAAGIGYRTVEIELPDRNAAKAWVIRNQFGRRNLTDFQRSELALELKPLLAEEAASREGYRRIPNISGENSPPKKTSEKLGEIAGVSSNTIKKVEKINGHALPEISEMARRGDVSINAAAAVAKLPKSEQKKAAAAGPKAVKQKAKEVRDPKPPESKQVDELDKPLPDRSDLRACFAERSVFQDAMNQISRIKGAIGKLPEKSRAYLNISRLEVDLKNARDSLRFAMPYAVCPYCRGKATHHTDCNACKGLGWVSEGVFDSAPKEMQKAGGKK